MKKILSILVLSCMAFLPTDNVVSKENSELKQIIADAQSQPGGINDVTALVIYKIRVLGDKNAETTEGFVTGLMCAGHETPWTYLRPSTNHEGEFAYIRYTKDGKKIDEITASQLADLSFKIPKVKIEKKKPATG